MKKIKINRKIESFGITLLLLSSFYFYEFTYLSLPSIDIILSELIKIFFSLYILNLIFLNINYFKYKNFIFFFYLIYILIFTIKLFFNASDIITLHLFIEKFFSYFIDWDPFKKPFLIKILSYLTPYFFITIFLIFFFKKLENIKKFLSVLGILISIVVIIDLIEIYKNEKNVKEENSYKNSKINKSEKKVLWILYDALDPAYLEKEINNQKVFQNLNILKDSGVFFENAYSPGKFTNDSVPATLMGINILKGDSKHRVKIFTNLEGVKIPFKFENTIFERLKNKGLDVSLMSSVLEYCSSYLRSNKWKICIDSITENKKISIYEDSLKFYLSLLFKIKNYFKNFINAKSLEKSEKNEALASIVFKDLDFKKISNLKFDNSNFYSDHSKIMSIKNIFNSINNTDMLFLHVYNPHTFSQGKQFLIDTLQLNNEIKDTYEEYFLRYLYVDLFTMQIINEIKNNNLNDILLIISSDHWWRSKPEAKDKDYIGNSFFLLKNLNDSSKYSIQKKSTTIIIPELIEKFFNNSISTNKEIYDYANNLDVKVHIKDNRFKKK